MWVYVVDCGLSVLSILAIPLRPHLDHLRQPSTPVGLLICVCVCVCVCACVFDSGQSPLAPSRRLLLRVCLVILAGTPRLRLLAIRSA